jgi:D-alanyl-lipoteichoic acid acyltransferase DltB (MBOAT superfamily)
LGAQPINGDFAVFAIGINKKSNPRLKGCRYTSGFHPIPGSMLFPTIEFVGFFLLFFFVWEAFGTTARRRQNLLAVASTVFYGAASPVMLLYLAVWSGVLTLAGRSPRRAVALGSVGAGILQLAFWKTFELFPRSDLPAPFSHWAIPLGVSFFTFQGLT